MSADIPNQVRCKVGNKYEKSDAKSKEGDTCSIEIYIVFKYDPKKAGLGKKLPYQTAKLTYGEYPSDRTLNYIWANKEYEERIITSCYIDRAKMMLLQMGNKNVVTREIAEVHIVDDYKKAFGTYPPPSASLAIMNDSHNTGEHAASHVDYVEIYR